MSRPAPGGATAMRPTHQQLYSRLYDVLDAVQVPLELDIVPEPAAGDRKGAKGYVAAGVGFLDPGAGRLTFTGTTIEDAARTAIFLGPDRARDYGCRAALSSLKAQLELEDQAGGQWP